MELQDFGFMSTFGSGSGPDAVTSGLEVIWSKTPTKWSNGKSGIILQGFKVLTVFQTSCTVYLTTRGAQSKVQPEPTSSRL